MANDNWPMWTSTSTNTTTYVPSAVYVNYPVTTAQPLTYVQSGGHLPTYDPPSLAEDELGWLRRRVTEVTDLFPVAA